MSSGSQTYAIYGFGRAGRSLARSLTAFSSIRVLAFTRNPTESQKEFASEQGITLFESDVEFLNHIEKACVKVLFVAVSDAAIALVASRLNVAPWLPKIVAHLSGALSGEELNQLSARSATAQFHPLVSLDGVTKIPSGSLIALNSDDPLALKALSELSAKLCCEFATLKTGDQSVYHAAAVLTGNLSLALVDMSQKLLQRCGIPKKQSRVALSRLLKSAALALEEKELAIALTGPLARGDEETIAKHVTALASAELPKEILAAYALLSSELLQEVSLPEKAKSEIEKILQRPPL